LSLFNINIEKVLNVKRSELGFVKLLFFHNFFQGIGLALFFTAASSIFLSQASVKQFPVVYMLSALLLVGIGLVYSWLEQRTNVKRLLQIILVFMFVSILLIRLGLAFSNSLWLAFAVIIWYRATSLMNYLEFWGLTSMMLDVRQSKRLFGLVSSGEVTAKLIGYFSIPALKTIINVNDLILIAAIAFIICLYFLNRLSKQFGTSQNIQSNREKEEKQENLMKRYLKSDFIVMLSILSFVAIITFTFIDFSFQSNLKLRYTTKEEIAGFLALFYGFNKIATFLVKVFFSGRIIDKLGVKNSLLLIPIIFLLIIIAIILYRIISIDDLLLFAGFAGLLFIMELSRYSIFEPVFFSLFQPLSKKLRLFGQAVVNGFLNPLALGIAGLILFLLIYFMDQVNLGFISYFLIAVLIAWIILVIFTNRQYIVVLQNAVTKRYFEGSELPVQGKLIQSILIKKIYSQYPEEVIYSTELLFKIEKIAKEDVLSRLLKSANTEVLKYALKKIEEFKITGLESVILELINTDKPSVIKESAINAYCSNTESDVSQIYPLLESDDMLVRQGAIKGLLKNGGLEAVVLSGQQLLRLIQSEDRNDNISAVEIIGDLQIKNFYKPIIKYFEHTDINVVKAAIIASGKSLNSRFISYLINFLSHKGYSEIAAKSLAEFKNEAIGEIEVFIKKSDIQDLNSNQFVRLCLVLGNIGTPEAHALLLKLSVFPYMKIRNESILYLRKSSYKANVNDPFIRDMFDQEFEHAAWIFNALHILQKHKKEESGLYPALEFELLTVKENMLNIIALQYDTRSIIKAREGLLADFSERKANALEIIDNIISKRLSSRLSIQFEDIPIHEKVKLFDSVYQLKFATTISSLVEKIISEKDKLFNTWTIVSAITSVQELNTTAILPKIIEFTSNKIKIIRETAIDCVSTVLSYDEFKNKIQELIPEQDKREIIMSKNQENTLLDLEKVIILKSTSLFIETPENILVDIANIIVEERVDSGKTIIKKGEMGTCMYIISEGEVKIHDNEMTFAFLKNRDFFGELSLLDPEPRSADVTATKDSLLLRLEQDAFYELMSERMEVAKGILKILCRRLRNQNIVINEMKAKMKA